MDVNAKFSSDKPIEKEIDDQFQRYSFSKRIAETILERKSNECIVIGIYGAWGEGKTSVINFVETELKKDISTITVRFNPWRFNDENSLLIQYFQQLANVLKTKLKTKSEKIGELLKNYGGLLSYNIPIVGNLGDKAKAVGELIKGADVEDLKKRIEAALINAKIRVVVFIDDIDRLDKDEIHSIFRLVKLNADFSNLVYILSFDEKIVSSAIAERFGNDSESTGQAFLEKIVQIPLKIPVAQSGALKTFAFKLIEGVLNDSKIDIEKEEIGRFGREFINNVLPVLNNPRLAIRYANTIAFSIPLLYGEVNTVDLLLIEALKIFYPDFYTYLKENPDFFIGAYTDKSDPKKYESKKKAFTDRFEEISENLLFNQKNLIKSFLQDLFPQLKYVFANHSFPNDGVNWYNNKRVSSFYYFNRYFTYSVIKGEISDIEFDQFIIDTNEWDTAQIADTIKDFISKTSPETVFKKIQFSNTGLHQPKSLKIALALSSICEEFKEDKQLHLFEFLNLQRQLALFLGSVANNISESSLKVQYVNQLLVNAQTFDFAYEILYWMQSRPGTTEGLTESEYYSSGQTLVDRDLKESGKEPIFEKFPESVQKVFEIWNHNNSTEVNRYLKNILDSNPDKIVNLIVAFTPHISSSRSPTSYMGDFKKESFNFLVSVIDKDLLNTSIHEYLKRENITITEPIWSTEMAGKNKSTENLLLQFIYHYKNDNYEVERSS